MGVGEVEGGGGVRSLICYHLISRNLEEEETAVRLMDSTIASMTVMALLSLFTQFYHFRLANIILYYTHVHREDGLDGTYMMR